MKISEETQEFFGTGLIMLATFGAVAFIGGVLFGILAWLLKSVFGSW
jgi:hypothetical protein